MIKSKAIDVIRTFTESEKKDFSAFISSQYFNKKKKLVQLYDIILKNLHRISAGEVSEELMFTSLFEKNKFSYSFIRNMMSELLLLCEKFLVVNKLRTQQFSNYAADRILLQEYNSRFLDSNFKLSVKRLRDEYKKKKVDIEHYEKLSKIEAEEIAFNLYRSSMANVPLKVLQRSEYNLCLIAQLLEFDITDLTVNMSAYNLDFKSEMTLEFIRNFNIDKFLGFLKGKRSPLQDELEVRLRLILLSTDPENTSNYFHLKKLILKKINDYSNIEKSNMLIKLKNYCAGRIFKGEMKFYDEKYLLAKIEAVNVEYNKDGVGPVYAIIYIETIQKALLEKDISFAKMYIKKFTKELEKTKQESMYNLALSHLEFHNNKFEKTLIHLSKVNPFNVPIKTSCKNLYLKTYYELNSLETGLSLLDSYIHYIKETKDFTEGRKKILKSSYYVYRKLFTIKSSPEKYTNYDLMNLTKQIGKTSIYYADWFYEKIAELGKVIK